MGFQYPIIGAWYQDREEEQTFEVVAVDEEQGTVEIQYQDGAISEFELEAWPRLPLTPAAPPEDSDDAYGLSEEDRWHDDRAQMFNHWDDPLANIEPDIFPGTDDD